MKAKPIGQVIREIVREYVDAIVADELARIRDERPARRKRGKK